MKALLFLAASAATLALAAPAAAAPIVYTFSGNVSGVFAGSPFSTFATFTGTGDTAAAASMNGVTFVQLSSLTALSSGITYTVTTPVAFATIGNGVGLVFNPTGGLGNNFGGSLFGPAFNGLSNRAPTTLTGTGFTANFNTDLGVAAITGGGNLTFSAVTSAVPEPATWALMIVGFGLVGAGMRRRQTTHYTVCYA